MADTKARMGRPPVDNPRTTTVMLRLTDDEAATLKAAAQEAGQPVARYVREKALGAAGGAEPSSG